MKVYSCLFLFFLLLASGRPHAQEFSSNNFFEERRFLFEVKQIDEFFERFNDEKKSFIRKNIGKYYPDVKIDRTSLLNTLFDNDSKKIGSLAKKQFVDAVSNHKHPYFISFYDPGWYAQVNCLFNYKGQAVSAELVMKIATDSSMGSKWIISTIKCDKVEKYSGKVNAPGVDNPAKFLSPMSHATNFIGLARAFDDKNNFGAYLDKEIYMDTASVAFLHACLNNELSFEYVKSVQYFFNQIAGWKFKVGACIKERSVNTGWLIINLEKTGKAEN